MNVSLTPDQEAFVKKAIESGRLGSAQEAIEQALAQWERRERRRLEIIAMIDEAEVSLATGEGRVFTKETTPTLIAEHQERLRQRIAAAEKPTGTR